MTPRPLSVAGGFSVLELLIVLAILSAVMTFALPRFEASGARTNLDAVTLEIAGQLKALRARAIATNREQSFVFDIPTRTYSTGGTSGSTQLPRTISIAFETAREASRTLDDARLIFYPTGGASGGRLSLTQDHTRRDVAVDWLTGTVTIHRDPK